MNPLLHWLPPFWRKWLALSALVYAHLLVVLLLFSQVMQFSYLRAMAWQPASQRNLSDLAALGALLPPPPAHWDAPSAPKPTSPH